MVETIVAQLQSDVNDWMKSSRINTFKLDETQTTVLGTTYSVLNDLLDTYQQDASVKLIEKLWQ